MVVRDQKHQEMYLRMYEKGRETALRERQEEVNHPEYFLHSIVYVLL